MHLVSKYIWGSLRGCCCWRANNSMEAKWIWIAKHFNHRCCNFITYTISLSRGRHDVAWDRHSSGSSYVHGPRVFISTLLDAGEDSRILMQTPPFLHYVYLWSFLSYRTCWVSPADHPGGSGLAVPLSSSASTSLTFWPSLYWGHVLDHSSTALTQQPVNLPRLLSMPDSTRNPICITEMKHFLSVLLNVKNMHTQRAKCDILVMLK